MSPGPEDGHHSTPVTPGMFYRPLRAVWARTTQTHNTKSGGDEDKENTTELSGGSWFIWQRSGWVIHDTDMEGGGPKSDPPEFLVARARQRRSLSQAPRSSGEEADRKAEFAITFFLVSIGFRFVCFLLCT